MRKRGKKTLLESASEIAESVLPAIESAVETVHDKAAPILAEGKAMASERFAEGRAMAHEKRAVATEKAKRGKRRAAAKAAAFAAAAPAEKLSALKNAEPEPVRKGSKLKKVLLLGVLVGIGAAVAKRLQGGGGGHDNWQSTYTPTPAPTPRATPSATPTASSAASPAPTPSPAPAAHVADDAAAASPDEALADQASEPHPDTTPDDPAEVVELATFVDTSDDEPAETPAEAPAASPYGDGSALPLAGGAAPGSAYTIKGNASSKLFHTKESPYYDRTTAEVWFTNEVAAEAAGFRHWKAGKD